MIILCIAYGAMIKFVIAGLPRNVPSIRNYLFLFQHIFIWTMVLLDVADLFLAIGRKLFLEENIVKNQCLSFVWILTDIGSVLSPW